MTFQLQNKNLNYLIDPTFTNVNRLFVLPFPRNNNTDSRYSYSNYYVPNVEIKDINALIDGKIFFDLSVKNKEEAYKKIIEMSRSNDYTTGNLLDFGYFNKNYRLIAIDLTKQTKLKDPQQINFIGKLTKNIGATMLFIIEKSEGTTFNFSQNSFAIIQIMETRKIVNLLNDFDNENSKFATRKLHVIDSKRTGTYSLDDETEFFNKFI